MSNAIDGFTLLYKTVEKEIQTKSDILVTVVHWQLLRAGVKCIGIGDDKNLSESDEESELLPNGWNINNTSYALRYKYQNQVFVLIAMVVEDSLMFNFLNGKSLEVSNASFIIEDTVVAMKGQLRSLIPDVEAVIDRIQKELFEPVLSDVKRSTQTQTRKQPDSSAPKPYIELRSPLPIIDPFRDLRDIGRSDLDPLGMGYGGGGMLFNPPGLTNPLAGFPVPGFGPGNIPGARFDPFNPPDVERPRRNSRDFDHFRPPGGGNSFNFNNDFY